MGRASPTDPALDDGLQMRPAPGASYVDLQAVTLEADHPESPTKHKARF